MVNSQHPCARPRQDKATPGSLDMFGWCTWDAFYSSVDGPGIERGVHTLRAAGSPPLLVIIDDGWQVCSVRVRALRQNSSGLPHASGSFSIRAHEQAL